MCSSLAEGYGSISSWYQCFSGAFSGVGFGVWKTRFGVPHRLPFRLDFLWVVLVH